MNEDMTEEERLLIRRACDKLAASEKRYKVTSTRFLNEKEQALLQANLPESDTVRAELLGGYDEAERKLVAFVPEYCDVNDEPQICAIRASYYKDHALTHRDILGAVLGLGISRETVGDILVDNEMCSADIIVKPEIKQFVLSELKNAGRASLVLKEISLGELHFPKRETETVKDTVASPRADAIASSGFGISRENAASLIRSGKLYVNRSVCQSPDKTIPNGAIVNAVGYGRFKVRVTDNVSKKGRIFIEIERYK